MNGKSTFSILSLSVTLGLILSAVFTVPALADGGSASPSRTAPASTSGSSGTPSGTKVVIVGSQGDKVPLGSTQAAQIMASGDPLWCPTTVALPTTGVGGCTSPGGHYTATSLTSLLGYLAANQPMFGMNGTIWIEGSYDSTTNDGAATDITIDSGTFSNMANFTLTIKGGWAGSGTNSLDPAHPYSTFEIPFNVIGWNNNVTINNIAITGATSTGLFVSSNKNITLSAVKSNNNTGVSTEGAFIQTGTPGATIKITGGTTATTLTQFNGNATNGLEIAADGPVTLTGITANNNLGGAGALVNHSNLAPYLVTVNGVSTFNGNWNDGLDVTANGKIMVTDVTASGNGASGTAGYGAVLDNCQLSGPTCSPGESVQPVALTGSNVFIGNWDGGLKVTSKGTITAGVVVANSNQHQFGAVFDNSGSATPQAVTLSGAGSYKYNSLDGLDVTSKGMITITNVTATNNGQAGPGYVGASLDNTFSPTLTPAMIKVTGTNNLFYNNSSHGLKIATIGTVSLGNVTSSFNGQDGVYIRNDTAPKALGVTLSGTSIFNFNTDNGLDIKSKGAITLSNMTAVGNINGLGALLENGLSSATASAVSINGTNNFSGNGQTGLWIHSYGNVTLANVSANTNGGAAVPNFLDGVTIDNTASNGPVTVTLNGVNTFNNNTGNGLLITSQGAINLNSLNAFDNGSSGGQGVSVDNSNAVLAKGVKLTGTSNFTENVNTGLSITSKGSITGYNFTVVLNGLDGVDLNNNVTGAPTSSVITLGGTNVFANNHDDGLNINAKGPVNLQKVTADGNGNSTPLGNGLTVQHSTTFTLTCGSFTNNIYGYGLNITASGAATFKGMFLSGNGTPDLITSASQSFTRSCPLS